MLCIVQSIAEEKKTEIQQKIRDEVLSVPIPKSLIKSAMKKIRQEKCAEKWLSQQGQYYYVCIIIAKHNIRHLIQCVYVHIKRKKIVTDGHHLVCDDNLYTKLSLVWHQMLHLISDAEICT